MRSSNIKPRPAHWQLYDQIPHERLVIPLGQKLPRFSFIVLSAVVVGLFAPILYSLRHRGVTPATLREYMVELPLVVGSALVVLGLWTYQYLVKPARNRRLGYRLVGRFPVQGKRELLGRKWLELPPDDTHRVGVPDDVYQETSVGDVVEVLYSATHDLVSVQRMAPPSATS